MVWLKILCTQPHTAADRSLSLSRPIYQLQKVKRFDADKWIQNGNLCELMLCEVYFWRVFMVFHSTATHLKYKRHHSIAAIDGKVLEAFAGIQIHQKVLMNLNIKMTSLNVTSVNFLHCGLRLDMNVGSFDNQNEVAYWSLTNEHTKKHFFEKAEKIVSNRYKRQSTEWKKH